ncbi:hypothetical protein PsYK624_025170 [Phanerochaete sordida]|uniref:Uncharacterized protein n=1 Tax=Phanerochaete sordida TaxID=48140 RepID=A0A9P3G013_9APHY|nr:hypothetical protein PsYK624_025170 [Phanerochaete sordida]
MFAKARSSVLQITTIYSLPSTLQRYFCHDRPTTQNAVAPLPPPTATQAPALTQDAANRRNACNILSTRRYELLPKCSTSSCEPSATIRYCIFTSGFLMCTSARDTAGPQDRRGAGVLSDANVAV